MAYKAITEDDPRHALAHWKYIKRYKKNNGKWGYVYDDRELKRYNSGTAVTYDSNKDGSVTKETHYMRSPSNGKESLFDTNKKVENTTGGGWFSKEKKTTKIIEYKTMGKLSKLQAKGEKWIYDKFLKNK